MISALDSGSSGPSPSTCWDHCVVFLANKLYSHNASLHPGIKWCVSDGGNPSLEITQELLNATETGISFGCKPLIKDVRAKIF